MGVDKFKAILEQMQYERGDGGQANCPRGIGEGLDNAARWRLSIKHP